MGEFNNSNNDNDSDGNNSKNFTNTTEKNFRLYENWKRTMKKRDNLSGQI